MIPRKSRRLCSPLQRVFRAGQVGAAPSVVPTVPSSPVSAIVGFHCGHPVAKKHIYNRPQPSTYTSPETDRIFTSVSLPQLRPATTVVSQRCVCVLHVGSKPTFRKKVDFVTAGGSKAAGERNRLSAVVAARIFHGRGTPRYVYCWSRAIERFAPFDATRISIGPRGMISAGPSPRKPMICMPHYHRPFYAGRPA